jgi:hypothetical protein
MILKRILIVSINVIYNLLFDGKAVRYELNNKYYFHKFSASNATESSDKEVEYLGDPAVRKMFHASKRKTPVCIWKIRRDGSLTCSNSRTRV